MNVDQDNCVSSMVDVVLNERTRERFPEQLNHFPTQLPTGRASGAFCDETGKVPTNACDLCALSLQCDLVAGGPQLQDRRVGYGESEKAHRREGLSNPVCL